MTRAALKAALLWAFGQTRASARLYRHATRVHLQTQATHVAKLARVWPDYVHAWRTFCGIDDLTGLDLWTHEGGWTPYPTLIMSLLTGKPGVVTNVEGELQDGYLTRAVHGAVATDIAGIPAARRRRLAPLCWLSSAGEAIERLGGRVHQGVDPARIPLASESIDICQSGGALEHYSPEQLTGFLAECYRVLRPGGLASHVLDHRDHLHHADASWPFLAHWLWPEPVYGALFGHQLGYHNRLPPARLQAAFRAAGFEPVVLRRRILPSGDYVVGEAALAGRPGLPRGLLARPYREVSALDRRTAAGHYLYRKPPATPA